MEDFNEKKELVKKEHIKSSWLSDGEHFIKILSYINGRLTDKASQLLKPDCTDDWIVGCKKIAEEVAKTDPGLSRAIYVWIKEGELLKCDGG